MTSAPCLCARTRRAARQLTLLYEESLRPAQLTPAQFELLSELEGRPGLTQTQLATHLALDQTTLSRNLRLLIERHWIAAAPSPTDRRKIAYVLTPAGKTLWRDALPLWQAVQWQMEERLGADLPAAWSILNQLDFLSTTSSPPRRTPRRTL